MRGLPRVGAAALGLLEEAGGGEGPPACRRGGSAGGIRPPHKKAGVKIIISDTVEPKTRNITRDKRRHFKS